MFIYVTVYTFSSSIISILYRSVDKKSPLPSFFLHSFLFNFLPTLFIPSQCLPVSVYIILFSIILQVSFLYILIKILYSLSLLYQFVLHSQATLIVCHQTLNYIFKLLSKKIYPSLEFCFCFSLQGSMFWYYMLLSVENIFYRLLFAMP